MNLDFARLRSWVPLAALLATVAIGWMALVRPVAAGRAAAADRAAILRQQLAQLQASATEPAPVAPGIDAAAAFATRVAPADTTAAVVERLAQLASDVRARGLFIETVAGTAAAGSGAVAPVYRRDPRFALFDREVAYTTIRMSFENDYAALGRFLWALRDLPTLVEVRTLNVRPARVAEPPGVRSDGIVRASMTLFVVLARRGLTIDRWSGAAMKSGRWQIAIALAVLAIAIAYNAWVFLRPAERRAAEHDGRPLLEHLQVPGPSVTGEPVVEVIDPLMVPAVPDVALQRAPEWPRNPFFDARRAAAASAPLPHPVAVEPTPVVASILHSPQRRLAIVNGRIVRVGDRIGTNTVRDIEPRAVIVESAGGVRQTLELRAPLPGGRR